MVKPKKSSAARVAGRKRGLKHDVEIPEETAFNEEDESKYGHFFSSNSGSSGPPKRKKKGSNAELSELWKYILEDEPAPKSKEPKTTVKPEPEQSQPEEVEEDKQQTFDRLEDDSDLFASDLLTDFDTGSYKWITEAPETDKKFKRLVDKFREIEEKLPDILQPDSQSRTSREKRKLLYEKLRQHVGKKWAPMLAAIRRRETPIVFGEEGARTDPTVGAASADLEPLTSLEKDLNNVQNRALQKALMAREQQRLKRINRIKSKRWHKHQRERDLHVAAKILEKNDDPAVTKELLEIFETKRAEKRLLRKRQAQNKWAKLALRYGGTTVLKQLSKQQQLHKSDEEFIKGVVDQHTKDSDDDEDDGDEEECSTDSSAGENTWQKSKVLESLKVLNDPNAELPQKGLFGLKFMKDAMERKREDAQNGNENNEAETKEKFEDEGIFGEVNVSADESDDQSDSVGASKPSKLPSVSEPEIEKAKAELLAKLAATGSCGLGSDDDEDGAEDENIANDSSTITKVADAGPKKLESLLSIENTTALSQDLKLEKLIESIPAPKEKQETVEIAQKLFVVRPDEENYIQDDSDDDEDDADGNRKGCNALKMPGWGSWTGYMLAERKQEPEIKPKKSKERVKISKKKDQKASKYFIHNLPHPYKNKHEYNATMNTLLGPEFNTLSSHAKLVEPKVSFIWRLALVGIG